MHPCRVPFLSLAFISLGLAVGCNDSGEPVELLDLQQAQSPSAAADDIQSADSAVSACTSGSGGCDAEIAALADSAYNEMSPWQPWLTLGDVRASMEAAVTFAAGTGGAYDSLTFVYTDPDAAAGTSVVINPGLGPDDLATDKPTPLNNDNQGVYADEGVPSLAPDDETGWYFINSTAGTKVNWYLYADDGSGAGYTVDELRAIETVIKHYNATTSYFFSVYTAPENDGNDAASWYRSRLTFVSSDFGSTSAGNDYVGQLDRDNTLNGDLEFSLGGSTVFSSGNSSLADVGSERVSLIGLSTNSAASQNEVELLLREATISFTGQDYVYAPVAASEPSDGNFGNMGASPVWLAIDSQTAAFNGVEFKLTNVGGKTFVAELVGGGELSVAQQSLLEKLDRGNGYNVLAPEAVFDVELGAIVYDFGKSLPLDDVSQLTASVYSDAGLTSKLGEIAIDLDGKTTTSTF